MTFTLTVDAPRWRAHLGSTLVSVRRAISAGSHHAAEGDLVPVAKGNGYGLGNARLVHEASRLALTRLAVGTVFEAADLASSYDGDILVLAPFEPADPVAAAAWVELAHGPYADRILRTISSRAGWDTIAAGPGPVRVVLEALTSMGRFGLTDVELTEILGELTTLDALVNERVRIEGLALHLPIAQPHVDRRYVAGSRWHDAGVAPEPPAGASPRVVESLLWGLGWQQLLADVSDRLVAVEDTSRTAYDATTLLTSAAALWVSHLEDHELALVRGALPDIALYARIGTRLWLGDRGAVAARGTVLAVHDVAKGEASGYRQRRASRAGAVVVIGGGTSHGVGLEAPSPATSARQRVVVAGTGVLDAAGRALSPFHIGGKQRWFAEPPHMQVSLVRVPDGVALPAVGDQVEVDVRMTTVHPDRILGLD